MKLMRISGALAVVLAAVLSIHVHRAEAFDSYWQGDVSGTYGGSAALGANAGNWNVLRLTGGGSPTSPRATERERAVIGTDNPDGALNSDLAPFGSPTLAGGAVIPGGIVLGGREFDFDEGIFPNPVPAAGALVGRLTFNPGASLTVNSTSDAAFGVDGRLLVGVEGRGFFTMNGGNLTTRALVVAGEQFTGDALGTSLVDLKGTSNLTVTVSGDPLQSDPATAIADFGRRLRVEGPNVNFSSQGRLRLLGTNTYTAVITSPTAHSKLTTGGVAVIGGNLNVEFSGAGTTHSVGQTWDLVDAAVAVTGNFSNLGVGGNVAVTGVPTPPIGSAYRLKKTPSGGRTLLQLSLERLLVLEVDRDTMEMTITNPHGGAINIDSYQVTSGLGSLIASYDGIPGSGVPGAGMWVKPLDGMGQPLNNPNALAEFIDDPNNANTVLNTMANPSIDLGEGFNRQLVADNVNNFGTDGEDLVFQYSGPGGTIIRGQVNYTGTKFENNLVLRVNPNTGQAFLKNDSLETLSFDGFSILSSTNALNPAGFTAITGGAGTWLTDASTEVGAALSQVNFTGSRTLSPTQEVAIGDVSVSGFATQAAQDGLSMQFILAESLTSTVANGDYNGNGVVDAADYTFWRDRLGQSITLPNTDPNDVDGMVTQAEYDFWKSQFGTVAGPAAEPNFRVGSILFDASAGSGSLAASIAVPEPSAGLLALVAAGFAFALSRRSGVRTMRNESTNEAAIQRAVGRRGVRTMRMHFGFCVAAVFALGALLSAPRPAAAVTGGIPLTNFDMELPGPTGEKVVAFATTAPHVPIPGIIPGWTFTGGMGGIGEIPGEGAETFGDDIPGDSGTEGGGNPGNELLLSTNDGRVYQIAPGSSIVNPPVNQQYKLGFDYSNVFTPDVVDGFQLTARYFYGAYPGTTLHQVDLQNPDGVQHFELIIGRDDPILQANPGAIGQTLGIEFDTTSREYGQLQDPVLNVLQSWAGIDNVVFEITGVMQGDLNGDGVVNLSDTTGLVNNLNEYTPFEANGELNGDNTVDLDDFRILKNLLPAGTGSGLSSSTSQTVPEPSSALLALAMAAGLTGIRSRRGITMLRCRQLVMSALIGIVVAFAVASQAAAELLYYDPFRIGASPAAGEYALGRIDPTLAPNDGQNPTPGPTPFFSNPWQIRLSDGDGPNQNVVETGLSYLGSPSEGGAVGAVVFTNPDMTTTASARVGRFLTTPWDGTTNATYYLAYQANYGSVDDPNTAAQADLGFRTTEFWPVGNVIGQDAGRSEVGFQGFGVPATVGLPSTARLRWVTPGGGTQNLSDDVFNDFGGTHLIVMKFVLSSEPGMDTISVYLDPLSTVEPELPTASASGLDYTLAAMSTISYFGTPTGVLPLFDELRVATTFAEAIPPLPLPGDTNGDDLVDLVDYQNIVTHMNQLVGSALEGDVARADGMQGSDGRVTIADYRLWRDNRTDLGGAGALAGQIGVPEPSALATMLAAAIVWASCSTRYSRARMEFS